MKSFRDLPIKQKMLLMTLLICGTVLLVAIVALFTFQVLNFRVNFQRDTVTLADIIANNSTAALAFKDAKGAAEVVSSLQAKPTVISATLVLPNGDLFAKFGWSENKAELSQFPAPGKFSFSGRDMLYTQPVELDHERLGTLYLRSDYRRTLDELLGFYGQVILGVIVASIFLAVFLSGRLQRVITEPILQLAQTAKLVGENKDYSLRVRGRLWGDELGQLTASFNEMLGRIQTQDQALKESREQFESLVHSIDGIVWERDFLRSEFTFVSRQSERILGYSPEQWLGQPDFWQARLHPEDASRAIQGMSDCLASRKPYSFEYRMLAADGRTVWIREGGDVLLDANGQPALVRGICQDITGQKLASAELERLNKQLLETSRQAGMAEVATGVLHNVGNVLNSINVSSTLIHDQLRGSEVATLVQVAGLLRQQETNLAAFLTGDPKGKLIPGFLIQLADQLHEEQLLLQQEHDKLGRNIEHIKEIVAMQQNYASVSGILEPVSLAKLADDALQMNTAGLSRHGIQVLRQYAEVPPATADKHKVLQILVNLVHNAKYALDESPALVKQLTVGIGLNGGNRLKVTVRDNGVGIPPENLTRIFSHGFSTRKGGHGFGLHSGANAAREMGGQLTAHSEGPGKGATFILELPLAQPKKTEPLNGEKIEA